MKYISYILPPDLHQNRVFAVGDPSYNRDDCLRPMYELRQHLLTLGVELNTQDITSPEAADLILMENAPNRDAVEVCRDLRKLQKPMLLNASESILVLPPNADPDVHASFDRVYTFQDDLIAAGAGKFKKFNYTFTLPTKFPDIDFNKKKLLCCVAGNKRCSLPGELYSERVRIIRWYEKQYPNDFDLYGMGWERAGKAAAPWVQRKIFPRPFASWKGKVANKNEVMKHYRFSLCFENAADISGYITEKIFDAMIAGSVPIYRGADNVLEHIPADCFIDYREFKSHEEMHEFIAAMSESEHAAYLQHIETFFKGRDADQFRHSFFVNTIAEDVCELLGLPFKPCRSAE